MVPPAQKSGGTTQKSGGALAILSLFDIIIHTNTFADKNTVLGISNSLRTAHARVRKSVRISPKSVRVYAQFVRNREHWNGRKNKAKWVKEP